VSLVVFLLSRTGLDFDVAPSLIAPLITLLPGALLTTSVIELSTGQMISGAGRLAAGAAQLVLLGLGILAAAALVGVPAFDLTATSRRSVPLAPGSPSACSASAS
jgi:Putative threonine/serine exporter